MQFHQQSFGAFQGNRAAVNGNQIQPRCIQYFSSYTSIRYKKYNNLNNPGFEVFVMGPCDNVFMLLLHIMTQYHARSSENQISTACVPTKVPKLILNTSTQGDIHIASVKWLIWNSRCTFSLGHEDSSKMHIIIRKCVITALHFVCWH